MMNRFRSRRLHACGNRTRKGCGYNVSAFTLVELLAAIAVLSILMVIIFGISNQTSRAWLLLENRTETFQGARLVLDMIGRELQGALVGTNTVTGKSIPFKAIEGTSNADISSYGGTGASLALGASASSSTNDQIFFVAPGPKAKSGEIDLHEYGYFVMFASANTASMQGPRYYLLRMDNDSNSDSGNGFDVFTNPTWYQTPTGGFGSTTKTPILDNVLRLQFDYSDGTTFSAGWSSTTNLPRYVQITLTVVDRRAAALIAAIKSGGLTATEQADIPNNITAANATNALYQTLLQSTRTFYKTVSLNNAR